MKIQQLKGTRREYTYKMTITGWRLEKKAVRRNKKKLLILF